MMGYMGTQENLDTEPTLFDVIHAVQGGFLRLESKMDAQFEEVKQEFREVKHRLFKLELQNEDESDTLQNHEERPMSLESWKKTAGKQGLAGA